MSRASKTNFSDKGMCYSAPRRKEKEKRGGEQYQNVKAASFGPGMWAIGL